METKDSLKDGVDRGYFTPERVALAQKVAERSIQCSTKLIVYLKGRARTFTPFPESAARSFVRARP